MKNILMLLTLAGLTSACTTPHKNESSREPQQVIGEVGKGGLNDYVVRCAGMNTTNGKSDLINEDFTFAANVNGESKVDATKILDSGKIIVRISASYRVFQGTPLQSVSVEVENVKANMSVFSLETTLAKVDVIKDVKNKFDNAISIYCSIVKK